MKQIDIVGELQKKLADREREIEDYLLLIDMLNEKLKAYENQNKVWQTKGRIIKLS